MNTIDFEKGNGLVPVVIQDKSNMKVLMLGYMNEEAYAKTKKEKRVCFYSRSKKRLWTKGESSGNYLEVHNIKIDCDADTLLIQVKPLGPCCHTGNTTCFNDTSSKGFVYDLENTMSERIDADDNTSYTNSLFKKGINKVAQKVGEEAVEMIIEAKDDNLELFKNEAADLMYHYLLLLRAKKCSLGDVEDVLFQRKK